MKRNLLLCVSCLYLTLANAQQRYANLPEGKTTFQTYSEKIIVSYKNGAKSGRLARFTDTNSLKQSKAVPWNILSLTKTYSTTDSLPAILKELRKDSDLLYANPILVYKDGTLQALTNKLIVRLKTSTAVSSLMPAFHEMEVTSVSLNKYIERQYVLTISPTARMDALDIANKLFETGLFDYCEPDFIILHAFRTNDPLYSLQWAIQNTGQYNGTSGADIKAYQAWPSATGCGIKVAVIDEGVDPNQPDLQGNLLPGYDALGNGTNGAPTGDDAHGTACAGIIAALSNNNLGVTGVSYNSKIVPVRVGSEGYIDINAAADGVNWAASSTGGNADILSCSWGGGSSSAAFNDAVTNAISTGRGGKGCVILFSSGDDNVSSLAYPSNLPDVIAVGGTNSCDQRIVTTPATPANSCNYDTRFSQGASFNGSSNYGTGLGIVAPGINIATTDISGPAGFGNMFGQGFIMDGDDYVKNFDGTSASCPFAAGTMALILSVNPNLTYTQATAILESTADKVGGYSYSSNLANGTWNEEMGYGRINAAAAVNQAISSAWVINGPDVVCTTSGTYTISGLPDGATVTWSVSPDYTTLTTSGNTATLTKLTGAGPVETLSAVITSPCNNTYTVNKNVNLQGPVAGNYYLNGVYPNSGPLSFTTDNVICLNSTQNKQVTVQMTNLNISNFTVLSGDGYQQPTIVNAATGAFYFMFTNQRASYRISFTSGGCSYNAFLSFVNSCNFGQTAYNLTPNPVNSVLTITKQDGPDQMTDNQSLAINKAPLVKTGTGPLTAESQNGNSIDRVRIFDMSGRLWRKIEGGLTRQLLVDVGKLASGIYIIEITSGKDIERQKVVVQH